MNYRSETALWIAQRASAAVLALCVTVHLVTIVYAVRGGLTAAEIFARTRGSVGWLAHRRRLRRPPVRRLRGKYTCCMYKKLPKLPNEFNLSSKGGVDYRGGLLVPGAIAGTAGRPDRPAS